MISYTSELRIHFVSFIFLPGPLQRDSHKPVQISKNVFKGLTRVESTTSSNTMDIEHVFKNNVTMDNVQNISKKKLFCRRTLPSMNSTPGNT